VCSLEGESKTAWAKGTEFDGDSWAMYIVYSDGELTTDLMRDQYYDVGGYIHGETPANKWLE